LRSIVSTHDGIGLLENGHRWSHHRLSLRRQRALLLGALRFGDIASRLDKLGELRIGHLGLIDPKPSRLDAADWRIGRI